MNKYQTTEPAIHLTATDTEAREHFQTLPSSVLVALTRGDLDALALAKAELAQRGVSILTGRWVGFEKAAQLATGHVVQLADGRRTLVTVPG